MRASINLKFKGDHNSLDSNGLGRACWMRKRQIGGDGMLVDNGLDALSVANANGNNTSGKPSVGNASSPSKTLQQTV